jgi:hypothetical protein
LRFFRITPLTEETHAQMQFTFESVCLPMSDANRDSGPTNPLRMRCVEVEATLTGLQLAKTMTDGELLTRLTIWGALCAYAIGAGTHLLVQQHPRWLPRARWAWTCACLFLLIHIGFAFHHYHSWSHVNAYRDTARQTAEMTGIDWGGGIYLNYLLAAAWLADVVYWWTAPKRHLQRSRRLTAVWHGFVFFMIFNGAVVFGTGPVRWFGILISAGLFVLWWRSRKSGIASRLSEP